MPLLYHPHPGAIVICDFSTGFRPPEIVKVRPVVIISPRRRSSQLVTVVPLSSTAPSPAEPWHHLMSAGAYPPARGPMWAKCDLVQTVSMARLDRPHGPRIAGKREYLTLQLAAIELALIMKAVKAALGIP